MNDIIFTVTSCDETGGYVARWNDSKSGGITTQGDSLSELDAMIRDAMAGYFEMIELPAFRLRFS
jgi:predicted RNase H-like HicB family nuclease